MKTVTMVLIVAALAAYVVNVVASAHSCTPYIQGGQ